MDQNLQLFLDERGTINIQVSSFSEAEKLEEIHDHFGPWCTKRKCRQERAYKLDEGSTSDKKGPMTEHLFLIRGLAHLENMGF